MVPTMKAKNRKIPFVQLDYLIHIQEIKPWPPSQSLRTLRSVIIQWELGDRNSGVTSQVVPSLGSGVCDGRIEFNESFKFSVTLLRELSGKSGDKNTFQKNCIEFNLVEPRRDKTVKGQVLGTAIIDLTEYSVIKESLCISAAINCKRSYRNTAQPFLFLKIEPIDRIRRDPLMRISSIKKNVVDSVSALMSEEYAEEAETASCTDDDVTSHSSPSTSSSPIESNGGSLSQNTGYPEVQPGLESVKAGCGESVDVSALARDFSKSDEKQFAMSTASSNGGSSRASSTDLSSWFAKSAVSSVVQLSSSYGPREVAEDADDTKNIIVPHDHARNDIRKEAFLGVDFVASDSTGMNMSAGPPNKVSSFVNITEKLNAIDSFYSSIKDSVDHDEFVCSTKGIDKAGNDLVNSRIDKGQENGEERGIVEESDNGTEEQSGISFTENGTWMDVSFGGALISPNREDKHRRVRSVRSSLNLSKSGVLVSNGKSIQKDMQNGVQCSTKNDRKDNKVHIKETRSNNLSDSKLQYLKQRVKKLEWELTETAAIEAALYSVVAEHGSSTNKVHAPARRLSRFIIHATKVDSQSGRANAAKSSVSGLIIVTKACGNDVPRLTFWLSNSILLRAIITESLEEQQLPFSVNPVIRKKPLKWQSPPTRGVDSALSDSFGNWEDPQTLVTALEKVEEWIVTRIIESIWWQTLTPHMQSGAAKAIKMSGDEDQLIFSLELWKKAFRDAYERICPVRADGHECGCLPALSRMIMEQCVARLDVAMLNAILRESGDDIPTDPVSDPISDALVLPIPARKANFGAGAQLKSAIGNWSRWLSDLLGLDHDPSLEDVNTDETGDDDKNNHGTTLRSFHLLNELSDLMMLPKDMLLSRAIRKEVCPTFGPTLIRRVVNIFIPDEFCPDPIPNIVLESLNSEDSFDAEENTVVNFPYPAAQIDYIPPLPSDIVGMLRDSGSNHKLTRSGSLLLTKSHTSDDELDVMDSPLSCIYMDSTCNNSYQKNQAWTSEENTSHDPVRYQLLRKIWNSSN